MQPRGAARRGTAWFVTLAAVTGSAGTTSSSSPSIRRHVRRALALAHRACVLENGRVVVTGSARALVDDERLEKASLGL
jgi:hypothetical protein